MKRILLIIVCQFLLLHYVQSQQIAINFNDSWKFLDNGSDQGKGWRYTTYNDSKWKTGTAKFGYGFSNTTTTISYGTSATQKSVTTYFRKTINIVKPSTPASFTGEMYRDDGVVVYVNGVEVYRNNMPSTTVTYKTLASTAAVDNGSQIQVFAIPSSAFINGTNVIAVEVHQNSKSTPDMLFDMKLSFGQSQPTVSSIKKYAPTSSEVSGSSVTYIARFSEGVTGVDVSDFEFKKISGSVSGTIAADAVAEAVSDGSAYFVTISNLSGSGVFQLDLKSEGTGIKNNSGEALTGGYTTSEQYSRNESYATLTTVIISSNNKIPSLAKAGDEATLSFIASEPIIVNSVQIAGQSVSVQNTGGNNYNATYVLPEGSASGVVPFNIQYSNLSSFAAPSVSKTTDGSLVRFDGNLPTVNSINRQVPSTQNTNATTLVYRLAFSEGVTGVDLNDVTLNTASGTATGVLTSLVSVGSKGNLFDVTVNAVVGSGELRVDLKNTGTNISDSAGNIISAGYTNGQTYAVSPAPVISNGFATITALDGLPFSSSTKDKPQAKVWNFGGKWWCVFGVSGGTKVFNLDGTAWKSVLTISSSTSGRADCVVDGDLVHILIYKGANKTSDLYTLKWDNGSSTYKLWSERTSSSGIYFPDGSETATLAVDDNGRMWVATDAVTDIQVWWSDAPYTTWSAPITLANNINADDICVVTKMKGGKIGVFWSNQTTKRFGFKTHRDVDAPNVWSADEVPASQSAINNIGAGMADDHMSIKVASDGTLYCAAKTGYDSPGYPRVVLLVRRPTGTWDNLYTVTLNDGRDMEGTQAIVVLNDVLGKVKVVYTTITNGGDIDYRESLTSNISFGEKRTLITGGGSNYNFATSTNQTYNPEVVILATNQNTSPLEVVGVLASDLSSAGMRVAANHIATPAYFPNYGKGGKLQQVENLAVSANVAPNPFTSSARINYTLPEAGPYSLILHDSKGSKIMVLKQGWDRAGKRLLYTMDGSLLSKGVYMVTLQTLNKTSTYKIIKN